MVSNLGISNQRDLIRCFSRVWMFWVMLNQYPLNISASAPEQHKTEPTASRME